MVKSAHEYTRRARSLALVCLVTSMLVLVGLPGVAAAWGPDDRETFTSDSPPDYVTFNSITDNPRHGDERDFVRVRNVTEGGDLLSEIDLVPGDTYEVLIYYSINGGVAQGASVRVNIPELLTPGESGQLNAWIGANNSRPDVVWDEVKVSNSSNGDVLLRYVPDSAFLENNGALNGAPIELKQLAGEKGAPLGFDQFDGVLNSGTGEDGYVTYQFVVDQPDFIIRSEVRVVGSDIWAQTATIKPDEEAEFRIEYKNTGTITQNPVTINSKLAEGLVIVPDSTRYSNANTDEKWKDSGTDDIIKNGINVGSYGPGANVFLSFRVRPDTAVLECGSNTLLNNFFASTQNGAKRNTATVQVEVDCAPAPAPAPAAAHGLTPVGYALIGAGVVAGLVVVYWVIRRIRRS